MRLCSVSIVCGYETGLLVVDIAGCFLECSLIDSTFSPHRTCVPYESLLVEQSLVGDPCEHESGVLSMFVVVVQKKTTQ